MFHHEALEFWGNISLLKGGINFSETITTVSPTYAREILTPEFGFGFEGHPGPPGGRSRRNPQRHRHRALESGGRPLRAAVLRRDDLAGKRDAKRALLEEARLPSDDAALSRPVIGLVSRLTDQKGFDLIGRRAEQLMALDATWVMLGSGERQYEDLWRAWRPGIPSGSPTAIGFDERLAHLIEAGADMFLMPSRFEPCGLNQMYSLRYGTIPIVRATGGLEDTVDRRRPSPAEPASSSQSPLPGRWSRPSSARWTLYRATGTVGRPCSRPAWSRTTPGTFRPGSMSKCIETSTDEVTAERAQGTATWHLKRSRF